MMLAATLPMYDLPELREANAAFCAAVARLARGADGPSGGGALFTQTCGYPLQTVDRGRYAILGTPCYDAPGCEGSTHRAFILVRADGRIESLEQLRGGTFAVNDTLSNTGMNLPRRLFAELAGGEPFFRRTIVSGSHAASMELVGAGRVDAASVDCVTYAFHRARGRTRARGLRVLAETPPSPALPFVTWAQTPHEKIAALREALQRIWREPRFVSILRALRIDRIELLDDDAYSGLSAYQAQAIALGYPKLA
jgi:ABC-type phosphate/phosphonate transport system substrate-binding protein